MILIPLVKNPVWWIHDFPQDIQEEYFKTHERIPAAFFSKTVLIKKGCALLLVLALFMGIIRWIGANSFCEAFLVTYGLWFIINWYDCFILDWIFFANIKAVRLPGTKHGQGVSPKEVSLHSCNIWHGHRGNTQPCSSRHICPDNLIE
ncbi:MAG: hypothetical protein KBT09_05585 [Bacteroidales bacterium]|nr:hypothetical protein [Candidatus Sodaliphilus fimicaballi]